MFWSKLIYTFDFKCDNRINDKKNYYSPIVCGADVTPPPPFPPPPPPPLSDCILTGLPPLIADVGEVEDTPDSRILVPSVDR